MVSSNIKLYMIMLWCGMGVGTVYKFWSFGSDIDTKMLTVIIIFVAVSVYTTSLAVYWIMTIIERKYKERLPL